MPGGMPATVNYSSFLQIPRIGRCRPVAKVLKCFVFEGFKKWVDKMQTRWLADLEVEFEANILCVSSVNVGCSLVTKRVPNATCKYANQRFVTSMCLIS